MTSNNCGEKAEYRFSNLTRPINGCNFNRLKKTLILLWSIILITAIFQSILSTIIIISDDKWDYHEYHPVAVIFLIHAITEIICGSSIIYGIKECDCWLCVFGCIWIIIIMAQLSWFYSFCITQFLIYLVIISFGYMLCLFMLSITFTHIIANGKHKSLITENQINNFGDNP